MASDETNPTTTVSDIAFTPEVKELVAIAAAVGSNCEPCLESHIGNARELGINDTVIRQAIHTAEAVKNAPARAIRLRAEALLSPTNTAPAE